MIGRRKKIVLYYPVQGDPARGETASKDLIPLALLTIAGWPDRDGYDVRIIDGNLVSPEEAHRRVVEACEGALLFATTGILGYQVADGVRCTRAVKAVHPDLPAFIGGWWASVVPEMHLATGLYDAVCIGQGELTFREIVQAVDAGEPLDGIEGLALWRDGEMVKTPPRRVVGWNELLNCPWHLLDIAPYRDAQLYARGDREVPRLAVPPGHHHKPFFGISYYGSFGCPEPCAFCCSPEMTGLRYKALPGDRMLDDLAELHERWGFQTIRFVDANWGVSEKRTVAFCEGLLERDLKIWWYGFMQSHSLVRYKPATLDLLRDAGMFNVLIGGETGDGGMMSTIGKHSTASDNYEAAVRTAERKICSLMFYMIGYPGETSEQMHNTIDECRRIAMASPLARPTVWPYRPVPGSAMYEPSLALGFRPPSTLEEWGTFSEYHHGDLDSWPGQLPPDVVRARKLFEHYYTLALGIARRRLGWWERRAQTRMQRGDFRFGRIEAKAFDVYERVRRRLHPGAAAEAEILPGIQSSVLSERADEMQAELAHGGRSSARQEVAAP